MNHGASILGAEITEISFWRIGWLVPIGLPIIISTAPVDKGMKRPA